MTEENIRSRKRAVDVAKQMLQGEIGIIDGSRQLHSLQFEMGLPDFDPDFISFTAIVSETDYFPVGSVRSHWAVDALAQKDLEITAAENRFRDDAFDACSRLVKRFQSQST